MIGVEETISEHGHADTGKPDFVAPTLANRLDSADRTAGGGGLGELLSSDVCLTCLTYVCLTSHSGRRR